MAQRIILDRCRVGETWINAVKAERFLLETPQGDMVLRSEAQLRVEFLKRVIDAHEQDCTGWCQREVLRLARKARVAMERSWPGFPTMYCQNASAALAMILRRSGYAARVVHGWVRIDKPIDVDGEQVNTPSHQWVEAAGLWIDLTADQFGPKYEAVRFDEAGMVMNWHEEGIPPCVSELEGDAEVLALVEEIAIPDRAQADGGDVYRAYGRYRTEGRKGWGLAWYLSWEFCRRFYASHGIVPKVIEHEGLGYYGIGLFTVACGLHGKEDMLGRFTMAGNVENWKAHMGIPLMEERSASGEPLPFQVRDAVRCFGLPPYPAKSHLHCRHKRWGDSYVLVFEIAALLALRHEGRLRIWNHEFHTEKWGRKEDPQYGQKEHPGYFLFEPQTGRRVLIAGDGRLILPYQGGSVWERYMEGASVCELAAWVERLLLL